MRQQQPGESFALSVLLALGTALAGELPATVLVSRVAGTAEETITVRDQMPLGAGARRFMRLKVLRM